MTRPVWHVIFLLLIAVCHCREMLDDWHLIHENDQPIARLRCEVPYDSEFEDEIGETPEITSD